MSGTDPDTGREVVDPGRQEEAPWRRLSPRMLLVQPVRELGRFIPALIGLFVAGRSIGDGQWWLAPVGVVGVIALSVLRWATTRYRITPEQVQLRTGLVQRRTVATPADRVRSVDVTASALHRLLGLAKVDIGTGSHDKASGLSLDSLPAAQAAALRAELLHRRAAPSLGESPAALLGDPAFGIPSGAGHAAADGDRELARLDLGWVRFAPFTMSGVLAATAILGVGWNLLGQLDVTPGDVGPIRGGIDYLERTTIWLAVGEAMVALIVFVAALSVGGYVLSYWGFRLTRHARGSLQVTRGLLTTRATSIEERRLRGVELAEPLLLRSVQAARLKGIATGLTSKGGDGGSSLLLPPAPRAVAREVATSILGDAAPMDVVLTAHGPAARQRRFVRALLPTLVLIMAAALAILSGASLWLALPAMMTVLPSVMLAADRYRSLGHALAGRFLVTRAGSLDRRRDVLACDGIIGWNLRQTLFQRRAGLATLTATTAAGRQGYAAMDVPLSMALSLADLALPGLLGDFCQPGKLDPAGEPHPELPLRVGDDLRGVDRVEEREGGDTRDDKDS